MLAQKKIIPKIPNVNAFSAFFSNDIKDEKVKIGKHHINYIKVGHGPHSCILTPGGLGTIWTNYKPQIEGFDRSKFTLVVWDPPGFGKSYPPERNFTSASYEIDADTGYELMKMLEIPKFSVLGWSAGGSASLVLAAKYPDAVRKLVVWGANAYILPAEIEGFRSMIDVSTWAKRLGDPMMEVYGKERFAQYWARWVDGMSQAAEENNMDICREWLKYIKCPTLVLHGGKDPVVYPIHASYLIENIKKSVLHIYPDGKHDIHMRYTKDFNRRVQDFVLEENVADI
ncbi:jg14232 [Pararge aegeria aegeria]|uniref:Jg14232 protein n=1 Tax=Pararge aegeria aegeria TaxID=348720 RepID=A0A8S4RV19_9NEOP|nr:jg14232 [Pararge aegeria aegeria]